MMVPRRCLVIADTDSRLLWAMQAGRVLSAGGQCFDTVLVRSGANPRPAQLRDMGFATPPPQASLDDLASLDRLGGYEAVVLGLMGPDLARFLHRLRDGIGRRDPARRPLLVTGYWGITGIRDTEGLLWRLGCDLICVNNAHDWEVFARILRDCRRTEDVMVPTGFLSAATRHVAVRPSTCIRNVVFVGQPNVPRKRYAKAYLLHHLIEYARQYPDRAVVIKSRMRPGERATHREWFSLESLCQERKHPLPPNLTFQYGALAPLFERADLVLTVSSAAAIEAWAHGKPVALISDFGIEDPLANTFFIGSNAFASWTEIMADKIPAVDTTWLARQAFAPGFAPDALTRRLDALLRRQEERGRALPMEETFFTPQRHPLAFGRVDIRDYHRGRPMAVLGSLLRRVSDYWVDRSELFE